MTLLVMDDEFSRAAHNFLNSKDSACQNIKVHHYNANTAESAAKFEQCLTNRTVEQKTSTDGNHSQHDAHIEE